MKSLPTILSGMGMNCYNFKPIFYSSTRLKRTPESLLIFYRFSDFSLFRSFYHIPEWLTFREKTSSNTDTEKISYRFGDAITQPPNVVSQVCSVP